MQKSQIFNMANMSFNIIKFLQKKNLNLQPLTAYPGPACLLSLRENTNRDTLNTIDTKHENKSRMNINVTMMWH